MALQSLLYCVDKAELEVQGQLGSEKGMLIDVDLIKCMGAEHCKTDKEIEDYFASMYMGLLKN